MRSLAAEPLLGLDGGGKTPMHQFQCAGAGFLFALENFTQEL
jgi:hypothetical protein